MRTNWTKEMESDLIRLRHSGKTWKQIPKEMAKLHEGKFTYDSCRQKYRSLDEKLPIAENKKENVKTFRESEEINYEKGIGKSDKLIELSKEQDITEEVLLKAHGYCPNEWQITKVKNSMWHHHNK